MQTDDFTKLIAIIFLLLLSAFFSSSETALFSLGKVILRRKKFRTTSVFKYTLRLLEVPSKFLTTVLIGNELVNISISVVVATLIYSLAKGSIDDRLLPLFSMAVTVPGLLLFGEILPKTIALKFPETVARINSYPLYLFSLIIRPVIRIFNGIAIIFVRFFVKDLTEKSYAAIHLDEDMFKSMVDLGSKEGTIEPEERELIHKVFHLDDIPISQIMTPRNEIVFVSVNSNEEELMATIATEHFSRYPVYEKDFDGIIGFVYVKDLLTLKKKKNIKRKYNIRSILREPYIVPEARNALSLFLDFQKNNIHIAVVTGKGGKVTGLITMEDILEELFGEIMDEHDIEEEQQRD